jgi:hypothetical protein
MRVIMAVANCIPAVTSSRAKYVDAFRVQTLFGAEPLDAKHFPDAFPRLCSDAPEGRLTARHHAPDERNFN